MPLDRSTISAESSSGPAAGLIERAFGGFMPPPSL
jgi:hypothetical protein